MSKKIITVTLIIIVIGLWVVARAGVRQDFNTDILSNPPANLTKTILIRSFDIQLSSSRYSWNFIVLKSRPPTYLGLDCGYRTDLRNKLTVLDGVQNQRTNEMVPALVSLQILMCFKNMDSAFNRCDQSLTRSGKVISYLTPEGILYFTTNLSVKNTTKSAIANIFTGRPQLRGYIPDFEVTRVQYFVINLETFFDLGISTISEESNYAIPIVIDTAGILNDQKYFLDSSGSSDAVNGYQRLFKTYENVTEWARPDLTIANLDIVDNTSSLTTIYSDYMTTRARLTTGISQLCEHANRATSVTLADELTIDGTKNMQNLIPHLKTADVTDIKTSSLKMIRSSATTPVRIKQTPRLWSVPVALVECLTLKRTLNEEGW